MLRLFLAGIAFISSLKIETVRMHAPSAAPDESQNARPFRQVSGKVVVIGMFAFGLLATGVLWLYWELHTRPFRPLQDALAMHYPGAAPRVDGGQRKMHKGTARILRIVMKVEFDPAQDEEQAAGFVRNVAAFVKTKADLSDWDLLEVHLYHLAETELVQRSFRMEPATGTIAPGSDSR